MAKTDNLNDFLKDIADAIREKKGTSDPINAQDFADEIKNAGNSGSGGSASTMEYWDVTALPLAAAELCVYGLLVKFKRYNAIYIRSMGSMFGEIEAEELETSLFAIALDKNIKMIDSKDGTVATVGEIFESRGIPDFTSIGWKQITEEEFYNLNVLE